MTLTLLFFKLHPNAIIPKYAHDLDAGFDLCSVQDLILNPGEHYPVPTGLRLDIPCGYEIQIRPRSGLAAKYCVTVLNAPGTIDAGYTGEIKVLLINLSTVSFRINPGDRIAQGVLAPVTKARFVESVDQIDQKSSRGTNGFGSTGVKS